MGGEGEGCLTLSSPACLPAAGATQRVCHRAEPHCRGAVSPPPLPPPFHCLRLLRLVCLRRLCTPLRSTSLIERYLQTGRSSAMDRTRVLLARHRLGHLVPVQARGLTKGGEDEGGGLGPGVWQPLCSAHTRKCAAVSHLTCAFHPHPLQLRIRDMPYPGSSGKGFTLLALIRAIDDEPPPLGDEGADAAAAAAAAAPPEERLLVDAAGVIRSGTRGALALLQARAYQWEGRKAA